MESNGYTGRLILNSELPTYEVHLRGNKDEVVNENSTTTSFDHIELCE